MCVFIAFLDQVAIPYETQQLVILSLFIGLKDCSIPNCAVFVDFLTAYLTTKLEISLGKKHILLQITLSTAYLTQISACENLTRLWIYVLSVSDVILSVL